MLSLRVSRAASFQQFDRYLPSSRPTACSTRSSVVSSASTSSPTVTQDLWAELIERRGSTSSTASNLSARSQCTEVMHECLCTLEALLKEEEEARITVAIPAYRRPSKISADEIRRWSQVQLPQEA